MPFPKIKTGLDLIDNLWQGFFKGRTYLLTGPTNSGKTIFCLQFATTGLAANEKVAFFSNERAEDVLLRAAALEFDIPQSKIENKEFLVFNLGKDISPLSDEILVRTIGEITKIVEQERPARLIFDPITSLLEFDNFSTLKSKITELIYTWEKFGVTAIITLGEPANQRAQQIFDFLNSIVTATIKLTLNLPEKTRTLSLQARLGHYPDFYTGYIKIEPGRGATSEDDTQKLRQLGGAGPVTKQESTAPSEPIITPKSVEIPAAEVTAREKEIIVETCPKTTVGKPLEEASKEEAIPEYPVRDLDRDDFTGLYNFDGILHIISQALEKKKSFSLMIAWFVSGVESRAKRLLLSQNLARAIKTTLAKPVPVGRYSDKIIVLLDRTTKTEAQALASFLKEKILAALVRENDSFKSIDIQIDVYAYPEEIRSTRDFEACLERIGLRAEFGEQ